MANEKEISELLAKKDALYARILSSYDSGASRARTTTLNREIGLLNDRIQELRRLG